MSVSRVDQLYRKLLLTKFFTKGWGKPDNLKRIFAFRKILSNREKCQHLVSPNYPIHIDKEYRDGGFRILEGHFTSPFVHQLPGIMPPEVETASFQMILPVKWRDPHLKPVCIHLAGTGDHFFWRRRLLTARPLLKESGIASIILENPYYGSRKPKEQLRSSLHNVSDLFVMGGALVLESMALLHWCEREGWGPLGLSGVSMGGHMASLGATNWTRPITLVPCLSWSTASCVFTEGVMSGAIPWETLQEQFFTNSIYQDEIKHLIVSPENLRKTAYSMGQQFVKDYSASVEEDQAFPSKNSLCKYEPSITAFEHHTLKMQKSMASIGAPLSSSDKLHDDIHVDSHENKVAVERKKVNIAMSGSDRDKTLDASESVPVPALSQDSHVAKLSSEVSESMVAVGPKAGMDHSSMDTPSSLHPALSGREATSAKSKKLSSPGSDALLQTQKSKKRRGSMDLSVPISVSYAKTKELQQRASASTSSPSGRQQGPLPLRHAAAKSSLMSKNHAAGRDGSSRSPGPRDEAFDFMRGVMDECTHLGNFSIPVDPELIIIISAKQDAYVPRDGVLGLDQLWPGCEVRYVDQGHVGAVLLHQKIFRKAIADAFDRQIKKYHSSPGSHHVTTV